MLRNLRSKTLLAMVIAVAITASTFMTEAKAASAEIRVEVNGNTVQFEQKPVVQNGRTLVSLREIFESLGMQVSWSQETKTVQASNGDIQVELQIGSSTASVGNNKCGFVFMRLDTAPQIIGGRTFVPVRFIGESIGADVTWVQETQKVSIVSNADRYFGTAQGMTTVGNAETCNYIGYLSSSSGLRDGFGQCAYTDGTTFVGTSKQSRANGYGIATLEDGTIYAGNFVGGFAEGMGSYTFSDGSMYTGSFKGGKVSGWGTYTFANGEKYVGNFEYGSPNGWGTMYYSDGSRLEGNWVNGNYMGK